MGLTERDQTHESIDPAKSSSGGGAPQKENIMKTNEGFVDRVIRVALGLGLISLLGVGPVPGWGLVGLVGAIPLVTGLVGYCPTYTLLGIDTRGGAHRSAGGR